MNAVFALLQGEDGQSVAALPVAPEPLTIRKLLPLAIVRALPARRDDG
jgi:hypothetical protein